MEDCSPKSLAATAAERWAAVYQASPGWRSYRIPSGALLEEVYVRLCALGPNPDPDAVDAVTGDPTWTRIGCDDCNAGPAVVLLGDSYICAACLESAVVLAAKAESGGV